MAWTRAKLAEGWSGDLPGVDVDAYSRGVPDGACLSLELHRNRLWPDEDLVAMLVLDDLRQGTPVLIGECEGEPLIRAVRLPFDLYAFLVLRWQKSPGVWPVLRDALGRQDVSGLVYWRLDLLQAVDPGDPEFRCGLWELARGDCDLADLADLLATKYRWVPWVVGIGAAVLVLAPALNALSAYYAAQAAREARQD